MTADEFVRLLRLDVPQDTIMPTITTDRSTKRFWALVDRGGIVSNKDEPDDFGSAVRVLVRLYDRCEKQGNTNLARRAQAALKVLLGPQQHLRGDDDAPVVIESPRPTLRGIGR